MMTRDSAVPTRIASRRVAHIWRFFRVLVNLALARRDPCSMRQVACDLARIDAFHLGGGWYVDGCNRAVDYYYGAFARFVRARCGISIDLAPGEHWLACRVAASRDGHPPVFNDGSPRYVRPDRVRVRDSRRPGKNRAHFFRRLIGRFLHRNFPSIGRHRKYPHSGRGARARGEAPWRLTLKRSMSHRYRPRSGLDSAR
jgi:hypothetical protein